MARRPEDPKPRRTSRRRSDSNETVSHPRLPDVAHMLERAPSYTDMVLQSAPREAIRREVPAARPTTRLLVGVVMWHNHRIERGLDLPPRTEEWLRAWDNAKWPAGCELAVVVNRDEYKQQDIVHDLLQKYVRTWVAPKLHFIPRNNEGRDIGALKHLIEGQFKEGDYTHLYWSTDDCLPMRPDFLDFFMKPFTYSHNYGLVGNYWVPRDYYPHISAHMRTVSFMLSRKAALGLKFPPKLLTREDCYSFEYGDYNMTRQVCAEDGINQGVIAANYQPGRPWYACNDVVWDCGEVHSGVYWDWRRRQCHWAAYEAQFEDNHVVQN
jgi:hypothetical protein